MAPKPPTLVTKALGKTPEAFDCQVGEKSYPGWRSFLQDKRGSYEVTGLPIIEQFWREFHELDIRLFVGPSMFRMGPGQWARYHDGTSDPPSFTQLFAIPGLPVLDIVEFCNVGSHGAGGPVDDDLIAMMTKTVPGMTPEALKMRERMQANPDLLRRIMEGFPHGPQPWKVVRDALAKVMNLAPFVILFADEAGLSARCLDPVQKMTAQKIVDLIGVVDPEAFSLYEQELIELGLPVPMYPDMPDVPDEPAAMVEYIAATSQFRMWWD